MSSSIQILVTTYYNNRTHAITLGREHGLTTTVHDLKKLIAKRDGMPENLMTEQHTRLMNGHTELLDKQLIGELGLANDASLKVYPRLTGFKNKN